MRLSSITSNSLSPSHLFLPNNSRLSQVIFFWNLLARHLSRIFDAQPHLRPVLPPATNRPVQHLISLSTQQENQISDIFNLFDTDGGGSIDRRELNFALVALGFSNKQVIKFCSPY